MFHLFDSSMGQQGVVSDIFTSTKRFQLISQITKVETSENKVLLLPPVVHFNNEISVNLQEICRIITSNVAIHVTFPEWNLAPNYQNPN